MPNSSKAPPIARFSKDFLLTTRWFARVQISKMLVYTPFSFRSRIISIAAVPPTPFIAAKPNRIAPSLFTLNFCSLSFTLGPRISIPIHLHSSIKKLTFLISFILCVSTDAINSAG